MRYFIVMVMLGLLTVPSIADEKHDRAIKDLTGLNDRFNAAAAVGNADALVDLYSEDTIWIAPATPPVQGLEEPRKLFEFVTSNNGSVTHTIDHLFVSEDATLAVMIGSVDARIESAGMEAEGTYLFVLEPEAGDWKIVTDMWQQHKED
ncbi:MAG: nuclear transport factor 2 family protein [Roseibium sp.]|uniref:YybH family protein n=1 Tax=Roseibium sp. TaxID=1936156 RepID=UPI0026052F9C|nr:nuclear transport factor 2 family protein [Roseibium sp.]MCV0429206.1 nuclear transport factor 2 family protein [Roseibium sp.]